MIEQRLVNKVVLVIPNYTSILQMIYGTLGYLACGRVMKAWPIYKRLHRLLWPQKRIKANKSE